MPRDLYERETNLMRNRISLVSGRFRVGVALAFLTVGAMGCDHLLRVQDPDVVTPGQVSGPDKLSTNLGASIGALQVGFGGDGSGGNEGLVNMTGLFTDEFTFAETFPTRKVVDQRNTSNNNSTLLTIFFNIQQARAISANASDQYNQFGATDADHSQVLSNEAYSQLLMAETYCSDVPFSKQNNDGTQSNQTPLTTAQMLSTAVATFDSAIDIARGAGDQNREFLARIGKARALMDFGGDSIQEADTVVATVPTTFVSQVLHSENTTRENNGVFELMFSEKRWSVSDSEGTNGIPFISAHDPRVRTELIGSFDHCETDVPPDCGRKDRGFDGATIVTIPLKDSTRSTAEVLASGVEARLIQAEAALNRGEAATWLADLNALRSQAAILGADSLAHDSVTGADTVVSMKPLVDPGTMNAEILMTMRERAFWLYASAHRLADMRRLTRPKGAPVAGYGFDPNTVFPVGVWKGTTTNFGNEVNFPIRFEEGNNPSFSAAQCDVTQP